MKTAVEWLFGQYVNKGIITIEDIEQAEEMEKEQMELCYKVGVIDGNNGVMFKFDKYYNETFKTN